MNTDFNLIYDYNFKYRLLICTMQNYYRKHYAANQFNAKILILGPNKRELMTLYDYIIEVIRHFTKEDIITLKMFIHRDKELKKLFDRLIMKGIDFQELLNGIKKEYVESKTVFLAPKTHSLTSIPIESSLIFM